MLKKVELILVAGQPAIIELTAFHFSLEKNPEVN